MASGISRKAQARFATQRPASQGQAQAGILGQSWGANQDPPVASQRGGPSIPVGTAPFPPPQPDLGGRGDRVLGDPPAPEIDPGGSYQTRRQPDQLGVSVSPRA